jgi:hypothetical protein
VVENRVSRTGAGVERHWLLSLGPIVEVGWPESPQLAYTQTHDEAIASVALKCLLVDFDMSGRLLAVEQRFEDIGEVGHGSYTP